MAEIVRVFVPPFPAPLSVTTSLEALQGLGVSAAALTRHMLWPSLGTPG